MSLLLEVSNCGVEIPARVIQIIFDRAMTLSPNECWPWTKSVNSRGYGQIGWSHDGKTIVTTAHRVAWVAVFGSLDKRDIVRQRCRARVCINPAHLEKVRCTARLRAGDTSCPNGHVFGDSEITLARSLRRCRLCVLEARHERARCNVALREFFASRS